MSDMASDVAYQLCPHWLLDTQNLKYFNKLVGPQTFQNPSRIITNTLSCLCLKISYDGSTDLIPNKGFWLEYTAEVYLISILYNKDFTR